LVKSKRKLRIVTRQFIGMFCNQLKLTKNKIQVSTNRSGVLLGSHLLMQQFVYINQNFRCADLLVTMI